MRFFVVVPREASHVPDLKNRVGNTLERHGAVRRRVCKRLGTETFALSDNSFEAFSALCRDLAAIHPEIFATSYKQGRKIQ